MEVIESLVHILEQGIHGTCARDVARKKIVFIMYWQRTLSRAKKKKKIIFDT